MIQERDLHACRSALVPPPDHARQASPSHGMPPMPNAQAFPAASPSKDVPPWGTGVGLVLGLVLLAVGLAVFAVWFQWGQTRRCLQFFGPAAARRIQTAERVELWLLTAKGETICVREKLDVSRAPGLVHLRRGLIEDVNYTLSLIHI